MKIAIFYYSQSGQALQAAQNLCAPLQQAGGHHEVVFKEIKPVEQYPFPWMRHDFFDTFPETRLGLPPSGIQPIDLHDVEDTDMVIIAAQPWFLSPSLPLQSFLADKSIRQYLNGRHVVFLNVCRNMWLMAFRSVKIALQDCGAKLIGHIVLQDEAPNLISALTIVRWLLHGKKTATWLLPAAGVSEKDLQNARRFGIIIQQTYSANKLHQLQQRLLAAGAIHYKPSILHLEKVGHRMFGLWARFIRRKGGFHNPQRKIRVTAFFYYLLIVLFFLSPFAVAFFYFTYSFRSVAQQRIKDCSVEIQ